MTRVVVVDDSAFMRHSIARVLNAESDIEVVGSAGDGIEAVELVRRLRPDVLTLDVEMPRMDGLKALELIMRDSPLPVVMLSSLTGQGAPATIRALELGAVEFVTKPAPPAIGVGTASDQLVRCVRAAARSCVRTRPALLLPQRGNKPPGAARPGPAVRAERIVVIGCSTGGPRALMEVVPRLPGNLPAAVLIVQHMPPGFTRSLADRLDQASTLTVREAEEGDQPAPGLALVAPGGLHMELNRTGLIHLSDTPTVHGVRPSVDVLLRTVPAVFGAKALVAILTGMGSDGAEGAVLVHEAGGTVLAEDASTTAVYGMPRAVVERGIADRQPPLGEVARVITDMVLRG